MSEYWLAFPNDQVIHQFVLDENDRYKLKAMYAGDDCAVPFLFPDLAIDLTEAFETWGEGP